MNRQTQPHFTFNLPISISLVITLTLNCALAQTQNERVSASKLYQYALDFYYENRTGIALEHLNDAIRMKRDYADAYLLRARILQSMGHLQAATTDYTSAIYYDPTLMDARFQRAMNYYTLDRFDEAISDFHYLLDHSSHETTTVYFKGKSDPDGFKGYGVTTLQSDMITDIYNYLGLLHLNASTLDSAIHYFDKAIERNAYEPDFYVNRGLYHQAVGDTALAIQNIQQALAYQTDHSEALANLYKLSDWGNYDQLLADTYDLAVASQGSYQAYFNRAVFLQNDGQHRRAIQDFDKALAFAATNDQAYLLRAYSRERSADLKGAFQDYTQALRLNPNLAKAYSNRANVLYKLKRYREAVTDYHQAISFFPDKASLYYNRGLAHYLSGQREKACADLQKSLEMGYMGATAPMRAYCQ